MLTTQSENKVGRLLGWLTGTVIFFVTGMYAAEVNAQQSPPGCSANNFDISIERSVTYVHVGDQVEYTIFVENHDFLGSLLACDTTAVHITGTDPSGAVTDCGTADYPAGTLRMLICSFSYTVQLADVDAQSRVWASAYAEGNLESGFPDTFSFSDLIANYVLQPSLAVTKDCSNAQGTDPINFTVNVENTSAGAYTTLGNIQCTDVNDAGSQALDIPPDTLANGQSITVNGSYLPTQTPSTDTVTCTAVDPLGWTVSAFDTATCTVDFCFNVNCNDDNACTTDTCNPANGDCVNVDFVTPTCDDSVGSTTDFCDAGSGVCEHIVDIDGDGIDSLIDGEYLAGFIDQSDVFSDRFTDIHIGGTTYGRILSRADLIVAVTDSPDNNLGVLVNATGGGSGTAQIETCGSAVIMEMSHGDAATITCGSVDVIGEGGFPVLKIGNNIEVLVPTGAIVTVDIGNEVTILNQESSAETITVVVDGQEVQVVPNESASIPKVVALNVQLQPMVVSLDEGTIVNATVQSTDGLSIITSAEYDIDGGAPMEMLPVDGGFDEPEEDVTADISGLSVPGVYSVCVRGIALGALSEDSCTLLAVYDPTGGFVTGGGWINSAAGAYVSDPSLAGKANFGFVSKYKKGTQSLIGRTEFQFQIADLNFHSSSYEWLVVAGAKAMFKGDGQINGEGNYGFLISAIDEALSASTDADLFRIKIWDKDNNDAVIYDNQLTCGETDDDASPCTGIGGGNIMIHSN